MFLNDDIADFGYETGRGTTKVEDHLGLVKFDFLFTILCNHVNERQHILAILK